ncbi:MAG: YbaN family protein [Pseudomonadota bacterium]|nr:YbaN family protein [Pseudomonadota bacterium]
MVIISKPVYLLLGWLSLLLACVGVVLPLLPTTPFVLLASFFFARGSPRLNRWLRQHPLFRSLLADWEQRGAINKKAKILATVMIVIVVASSWSSKLFFIIVMLAAVGLVFIWTRPH